MARQRLVFNFDLCTGCRICGLICSFSKEQAFNPRSGHLRIVPSEDGLFNDVVVCAQCENAACIRVCPVEGALRRDDVTGAVVVDIETCTGCGQCAQVCPAAMIELGSDGKARKCDLCGGDPLCVEYCPTGALFLAASAARAPTQGD